MLAYQPVPSKPPGGVGPDANGVLSRVMRGERETSFSRIVTGQNDLAKRVFHLWGEGKIVSSEIKNYFHITHTFHIFAKNLRNIPHHLSTLIALSD